MAVGVSPPLTADSVTTTAQAAARAVIPPFATTMPKPEGGSAAPGSTDAITRPDHVHPRLTATGKGTLDTNGLATVVFTQVFDAEPGVTVTSVDVKAGGKPVPRFDVTFAKDAQGRFTGCSVYGERQRPMPTLAQASGGLLGTLVTSVNTVLAPLSGFLPTEPAAGAGFSLIAVKTSAGT
jgi:hypothetical protein